MTSLSKFAICLSDQHLQHSTLMGHITSIIDQKLLSIHDMRLVMKHLPDSHTRRHFFHAFLFFLVMFSQNPHYSHDQRVIPGVCPASGCPH